MSVRNWNAARLEDLTIKVGSGSTPRGGEANYKKAGVPLIRSMNVVFFGFKRDGLAHLDKAQAAALDNVEVRGGDVLLNITGASIGRVTIAPVDMDGARVNQHVCIIRPSQALDARYLNAYLSGPTMQQFIFGENYGVTRQALTKQQILDFEIPLAPLAEQKRIADKLEAVLGRVDTCRARLDRVPALLKRFRQSVLAAATSGRLTEEWRMTNGMNDEWEETNVGNLCTNSFYGPRFGKNEYTTSARGVPTVRTTDMTRDGRIEITADTPRVLVPEDKLEHFRALKDDLLVTRTGSIGIMAIFDEDFAVIPSAYLIRFRFSHRVLTRYMFFHLMSPYGQECLGFSSTAITQPNINAEAIKRIRLSLPSLPEQQEIVRRVEALFAMADRIEARLATAQKTIQRLTPATLAKAFRGELAPQDPNDEPASALLGRLGEQEFSAPAKATRGKRPNKSPA